MRHSTSEHIHFNYTRIPPPFDDRLACLWRAVNFKLIKKHDNTQALASRSGCTCPWVELLWVFSRQRIRLSGDKRVSAQIELITYSHADTEVDIIVQMYYTLNTNTPKNTENDSSRSKRIRFYGSALFIKERALRENNFSICVEQFRYNYVCIHDMEFSSFFFLSIQAKCLTSKLLKHQKE